jgi:hypothetical protein
VRLTRFQRRPEGYQAALKSEGPPHQRLYDPRQCGFRKHLARSPEAVIRHWCIVVKWQSIVLLRLDLNRSIQYGNRGSWR